MCCLTLPDNLVDCAILTEHLIQNSSYIVRYAPSHVNVNRAIVRQEVTHEDQAFVEHCDEAICAASPGVPVRNLLQQVSLLVEGLIADLDVHTEICTYVEWRIDIDQLEAPCVLDLFT